MDYRSTQGNVSTTLKSSAAIIQGLSPDGGLYVPVKFPQPSYNLQQIVTLPYQQLAAIILNWFFDDFPTNLLTESINEAYNKQWDAPAITPVSSRHAGNYYLELFHGPTLAFKDVALQLLPRLMKKAATLNKLNKKIVILTATSGDTGTASMHGFSDQNGTEVIVFYPAGGVSSVQLHQMLSQPGVNLHAIGIEGNFDNAQTSVKHIFNDLDFNKRLANNDYLFSSANSMNIGRLIPQIVYYFSAYGQLLQQKAINVGNTVNFAVPTGNFGDILAGYYAKKLGLPINKLICASDENNVLTEFFTTGVYDRRRKFFLTNSPAMDILVSSNLERLLFDLYNQDSQTIADLMHQLVTNGRYQISNDVLNKLHQQFIAGFATPKKVEEEIKRVYENDSYVIDPHTAVASYVTNQYQQKSNDQTPTIIVSTASPYKFPETVYHALTSHKTIKNGLPAIHQLHNLLGDQLSQGVNDLLNQTPRHENIIKAIGMKAKISEILGLS
ncbi:threonine synthase [Limosilactobacillus reuteri]|uniref:Threonine synthase n=1 Tax=Limosilactobacillus reuteri TaxID=1598 RepID=A0A2S1ESX3_LIMRT|nr:threonine synthase [Limosilactobacillus reuteri]AWD63023.1 threonine synthase [Limosilactobacillus reuteri]